MDDEKNIVWSRKVEVAERVEVEERVDVEERVSPRLAPPALVLKEAPPHPQGQHLSPLFLFQV